MCDCALCRSGAVGMNEPIGFLPSRGKNTKYQPPDMSAPIKVVDGQRIIGANAIAEAMADDKFTAQDLYMLIWEEDLMWGDVRIE